MSTVQHGQFSNLFPIRHSEVVFKCHFKLDRNFIVPKIQSYQLWKFDLNGEFPQRNWMQARKINGESWVFGIHLHKKHSNVYYQVFSFRGSPPADANRAIKNDGSWRKVSKVQLLKPNDFDTRIYSEVPPHSWLNVSAQQIKFSPRVDVT